MRINFNTINFQSNPYREREMARLRELQRQREIQRQRELERQREIERQRAIERQRQVDEAKLLDEIASYPSLDDEISTNLAGFLSQFTCAIQNDSEHDMREFYADEQTAAELRSKLSPECQHDSIELRKEFQKLEEVQDPVMALICANRMKKFAPKKGILSEEQHTQFVEGIKATLSTIIRSSDMSKFSPEDRSEIILMTQQIENATSVDFGISARLKALVDKLNAKVLKRGFIPPVQVKQLDMNPVKKALK